MRTVPVSCKVAAAVVLAVVVSCPAWGVIQVLIPLQNLLDESDNIVLLEVEKIDPDRPSMVLKVKEDWKGKATFEQLPINLTGDKEKHTPKLLKRVAPKLPVIGFVRKQDAKTLMMLAYTNGTWFQVMGTVDGKTTRWAFTHCEIYLRRTYRGSTSDLQKTVKDVLAGKAKAPPADTKAPPGFGPEVEPMEKAAEK